MSPILACKLLEAGPVTITSFYPQKCLKMAVIQNHVLNEAHT